MKAIVTGANGFVGSSLVNKLSKSGIEVLAIDICLVEPKFDLNRFVKTLESNLGDLEVLKRQIPTDEYDIFYNFAWKGVNGPDKAKYDVQIGNIYLSLRCAELAKQLGCQKYLCAGTIAERAVESIPLLKSTTGGLMYAVAKHCNHLLLESYCKNIGLDFVWMQFSNVYGPNNKTGNLVSYTLNQLKIGENAIFGPAKQPYDFIYCDDLIEAVYRLGVYDTNSDFYFIGSGNPLILSDYLEEIGLAYGRPDLIRIGEREDDGIKYSFDMFDVNPLIKDIGNYVDGSFKEKIRYTIKNY